MKCEGLPFSKTRIQSKETPRSCLGSFHVTEMKPPYQIGSDLPVFTFCFGNLLVILCVWVSLRLVSFWPSSVCIVNFKGRPKGENGPAPQSQSPLVRARRARCKTLAGDLTIVRAARGPKKQTLAGILLIPEPACRLLLGAERLGVTLDSIQDRPPRLPTAQTDELQETSYNKCRALAKGSLG